MREFDLMFDVCRQLLAVCPYNSFKKINYLSVISAVGESLGDAESFLFL